MRRRPAPKDMMAYPPSAINGRKKSAPPTPAHLKIRETNRG
jgi:hypothetical protein